MAFFYVMPTDMSLTLTALTHPRLRSSHEKKTPMRERFTLLCKRLFDIIINALRIKEQNHRNQLVRSDSILLL